MQVKLSPEAQQLVECLIAQGDFQSADEAVEYALEFFKDHRPTWESLKAELQAAREDVKAGRTTHFQSDEELKQHMDGVKRQGRKRLTEQNGP